MKKHKWVWDAVKILAGLLAAVTLAFSRVPDRAAPGYVTTPNGPPVPMEPAIAGVAQSDWVVCSVALGIIAATIVAVDGIFNIYKAKKIKEGEALKRELRTVALGLLKTLSEYTGINIVYLGCLVFKYKSKRKTFTLESLERFRLDDYPPRSNVKWTGPKGAIGLAAEFRKTTHCNWVALSKKLNGNEESVTSALSQITGGERLGFSNDELKQLAPRYYESLATPILSVDGTKILGILAIDIPNRSTVDLTKPLLGGRDVEEKLAVPAAALLALKMDPGYNPS